MMKFIVDGEAAPLPEGWALAGRLDRLVIGSCHSLAEKTDGRTAGERRGVVVEFFCIPDLEGGGR